MADFKINSFYKWKIPVRPRTFRHGRYPGNNIIFIYDKHSPEQTKGDLYSCKIILADKYLGLSIDTILTIDTSSIYGEGCFEEIPNDQLKYELVKFVLDNPDCVVNPEYKEFLRHVGKI